MATNKKLTDLDSITWSSLASSDQFLVVDVSDTTMGSGGTNKRVPKSELELGLVTAAAAPELIRDTIAAALSAGSNITITVNDAGDSITISAAGGTSSGAKVPTTAGQCGTFLPDTCATTTVATQSSASAQSAWWFPFWLPRSCTPTVNQYCWTLESGSTLRASLWSNNDATFKPSTLLEDLGTMSGSATGAKSVAATEAVDAGWVWVGLWASNHTTVRWNRYSGAWNPALMGDVDPMATRIAFGWTAGGLDYSSAWPGTLPTLTAANSVTNAQAAVPYLTNV